MRQIVPIAQLQNRIPTAGRLRFGEKGAKGAPKAIDHWRFTSHDREAIEQVATIYGGAPEPWDDAPTPGQWQVTTEAAELHVVLPPDPLGGSPVYELWSGGGCQRRCDGVMCSIPQRSGPDDVEMVEAACICDAKGEMECAVKTRLSVILPDVKFAGVWRLDSGSWNVAHEMPGMVELIASLQQRGLTRGLLALEHRKSTSAGRTRRFICPVLRMDGSMDQLASGQMQVGALAQVDQQPELVAGEPQAAWAHPETADAAELAALVDEVEVLLGTCADLGVEVDAGTVRRYAGGSVGQARKAVTTLTGRLEKFRETEPSDA